MKLRMANGEWRTSQDDVRARGETNSSFPIRQASWVRAFSLLEVMIATGIFFMAMFAILGLIAGTLRNARGLQKVDVDAGMLAAQLSLTNKLSEESVSDDFGDLYPGYTWRRDSYLWPVVATNGLFQVDFAVSHQVGNQPVETHMSILLFRPDSQQGLGVGGAPPR